MSQAAEQLARCKFEMARAAPLMLLIILSSLERVQQRAFRATRSAA